MGFNSRFKGLKEIRISSEESFVGTILTQPRR